MDCVITDEKTFQQRLRASRLADRKRSNFFISNYNRNSFYGISRVLCPWTVRSFFDPSMMYTILHGSLYHSIVCRPYCHCHSRVVRVLNETGQVAINKSAWSLHDRTVFTRKFQISTNFSLQNVHTWCTDVYHLTTLWLLKTFGLKTK